MTRRLASLLIAVLALVAGEAAGAQVKALSAVPGAQVWFAEDHTLPMITLVASFPAGSSYDPPGKGGMASLAASLLEEGAGGLDTDAFQAALAARGIRFAVETGRDYTTVTLIALSQDAKEAFRLLGLALNRPRFTGDATARVREQMIQDLALGDEDPAVVAERGFYSLYFGPYTYGRAVEGDRRGLEAVTTQDVHDFAVTHWVRGGLKIAVAGDADTAAVTALLRAAFGGLPVQAPPLPSVPPRVGAAGLHLLKMDVPQPAIFFGLPGLRRDHPDFMAAVVANQILGGGESSRLSEEVRETRGLTYDITTGLVPYRRAGLVVGEVATRRDAVRRTIAVVRETMQRFASDGPTDRELSDAKLYLNGSFPLSFASNADIAAQLNAYQQMGLPLDYLGKRAGRINKVTIADVRRVARRLFDPSKMTIVVAGSLGSTNTEPADSSR
jgi:zinc protease